MNSSITTFDIQPSEYRLSTADAPAAFAVIGARSARRAARPWPQRAAIVLGVILLQIGFVVAMIKGGYVSVPRLPESLTVVNLPAQELTIKQPPPKMPEMIIPVVPIETPITIDVQSETAITVPPPRQQTAPVATGNGGGTSVVMSYQAALLRHIASCKRYPPAARAQQRQGTVVVKFAMDRTGRVLTAMLAGSSKSAILDQEGVDAVLRASPMPVPPQELAGDPLSLVVAVEFSLH